MIAALLFRRIGKYGINDGIKGDMWVLCIIVEIICSTCLVVLMFDLGGIKGGIRCGESFLTIE